MAPLPADSLRRVLDSVFAQPAYRWAEARRPLALLERFWEELSRWVTDLHGSHPLAFEYLWWGSLALLLLIFLHAAWIVARTIRAAAALEQRSAVPASPRGRDAGWYLREAERLAREARFRDAVYATFVALALELDSRRVLRFHPSKTPSEYAREARLPPEERERLAGVVRALYRYSFAGDPCGPEEYRAWRELAAPPWHATAN
jgi:hypothetical protein